MNMTITKKLSAIRAQCQHVSLRYDHPSIRAMSRSTIASIDHITARGTPGELELDVELLLDAILVAWEGLP